MKDGGPAFPRVVRNDVTETEIHYGMSLRDYFAAQTLAGMFANSEVIRRFDEIAKESGRYVVEDAMAESAYATADAMLKAREADD